MSPELARTFLVNCDSKDATIARALERAEDGDTIRVTGACTETVTIDKAVVVDRGGQTSISPNQPTDRAVTVLARGVTLRGLTFEAPAAFQVVGFGGASLTLESSTIGNATTLGVVSNTTASWCCSETPSPTT